MEGFQDFTTSLLLLRMLVFLVDADDDILSFDPLAPNKKKTEPGSSVDPLSTVTAQRDQQGKDIDLKDFDPLSPDEIEEGIRTEKMNADLLKRSRQVVSNRASAGKSWLERTFSNSMGTSPGIDNAVIILILLFIKDNILKE